MKTEIERKFLVKDESFKAAAVGCRHLVQGYLSRESGRTVRVRIDDDKAFLTIKSRSTADGTSRSEWEYEIPAEDARSLMTLCPGKIIDKERYIVPAGFGASAGGNTSKADSGRFWEVDVFHGAHEGLILAEIELGSSDEPFSRPAWLGQEVTGDRRYYNSVLSAD